RHQSADKWPYRLHVANVAAFALPGGTIFVNRCAAAKKSNRMPRSRSGLAIPEVNVPAGWTSKYVCCSRSGRLLKAMPGVASKIVVDETADLLGYARGHRGACTADADGGGSVFRSGRSRQLG